jgi:hypothetical protein
MPTHYHAADRTERNGYGAMALAMPMWSVGSREFCLPRRKLREAWNEATGHHDFEEHGATLPGRRQPRRGLRGAGSLNGGLRPIATRRRPSSIHPRIRLSSAPAAMQKLAAAFDLGSSSSP